jgi:hypothetical protein
MRARRAQLGDLVKKLSVEMRKAIEEAPSLRRGEAFLPQYLKGRRLSKGAFSPVIARVAKALGMTLRKEVHNPIPRVYECGHRQRVDYAFYVKDMPVVFLELETLDRAQLYVFVDSERVEDNENKLWYYYVTLGERHREAIRGPRLFVWILVLPDEPVGPYQIWDSDSGFFFRQLQPLIRESPFRFYDPLIKASARLFLRRSEEFPEPSDLTSWSRRAPKDLQHLCQLVFLTVTRKELIVSRGRHLFAAHKERRMALRWRTG